MNGINFSKEIFELSQEIPVSRLLPGNIDGKKKKPELVSNVNEYYGVLSAVEKTSIAFKRALIQLRDPEIEIIFNGDKTGSSIKDLLMVFDPLVGENACEIRTLFVILFFLRASKDIARSIQDLSAIEILLKEKKKKIEKIAETTLLSQLGLQQLYNKQKVTSLKSLIEKEDLGMNIPEDLYFLTQCYLLTAVKVSELPKKETPLLSNDTMDEERLINVLDKVSGMKPLSSRFLCEFVNELRFQLSKNSVVWMRNLAKKNGDSKSEKMLGEDFTIRCKKKDCIPMFWTYKVILFESLKKNIPIVYYNKFLVEDEEDKIGLEETLFFQPINGKYEETVPQDLKQAVFVVEGVVRSKRIDLPDKLIWKNKIAKDSTQIILAGAADHRQYLDPNEDKRIEKLKDEEYVFYREMAKKEGYSQENPKTFFIKHVYGARVGSFPQLVEKIKKQNLDNNNCNFKE